MIIVCNILSIILLVILGYEDHKTRNVSLSNLADLFVFLLTLRNDNFFTVELLDAYLNIVYVIINILAVYFYFRVFKKQNNQKIKNMIGAGDIVFIFISCFCFKFLGFLIFLLGCLLTSLLFAMFLYRNSPIPLILFLTSGMIIYQLTLLYEKYCI